MMGSTVGIISCRGWPQRTDLDLFFVLCGVRYSPRSLVCEPSKNEAWNSFLDVDSASTSPHAPVSPRILTGQSDADEVPGTLGLGVLENAMLEIEFRRGGKRVPADPGQEPQLGMFTF
jgi:hypothetical protein